MRRDLLLIAGILCFGLVSAVYATSYTIITVRPPVTANDTQRSDYLGMIGNLTTTPCTNGQTLTYSASLQKWGCATLSSSSLKISNQTVAKDQQIVGINNVTGAITRNQFSVNTISTVCSGTDKVSTVSIDNATGYVTITCTADQTGSGGATMLAANVTGTLPGTDYLVWTIPLTANSGNVVRGTIVATSTVSGTAVQAGANVTNLNTRGFCHWQDAATTTTDAVDNIVMNTVLTGRATKNAETLWIAGANVAMPINFQCAVTTGATPGNLRVFISPEIAGATISAKAGSFYIKGP